MIQEQGFTRKQIYLAISKLSALYACTPFLNWHVMDIFNEHSNISMIQSCIVAKCQPHIASLISQKNKMPPWNWADLQTAASMSLGVTVSSAVRSPFVYNNILHTCTTWLWSKLKKNCWDYKLTKDTPQLAHEGELWGVFCEFLQKKFSGYNGTAPKCSCHKKSTRQWHTTSRLSRQALL